MARTRRVTASRLRGIFHGDKDRVDRRNPFAVFRLGKRHAQTKALRNPGATAAWSGEHVLDDVDLDGDRVLLVTVYDNGPPGPTTPEVIGTAAVPLNAQTGQEVRADLLDPSNNHVGAVEFHLDTHGHDFQEPPGTQAMQLNGQPHDASRAPAVKQEVIAATAAEKVVAAPEKVEVVSAHIIEAAETEPPPPGSPPERGGACESKTYTVIEDRPIEFERRTTVLEHHLFEKTFAVETRLVAERELTDKTTAEVVNRAERVVAMAKRNPRAGAPELLVQR